MFTRYTWRGEPIPNIKEWAEARGERMVRYEAKRQTVYGPESFVDEMPESFWNSLLWSNGWQYRELT